MLPALRSWRSWAGWSSDASEQLVVVGEVRGRPLVRLKARRETGERRRRGVRCLDAAGEDRDRAPVDRPCRQRASDGKLDLIGAVIAAQQHDVDDLAGGVRAPVAASQG